MWLWILTIIHFLQTYFQPGLCSSPSVIIVGAGPAGVAAATRLLQHGHKNLTVLEAENRVGGRVNSVFFGEAFLDLGAEWCHGEKDNIVYRLVKDLNILRHTEVRLALYHSSRKSLDKDFAAELATIMEDTHHSESDREEGTTLGHYLSHKFNSTIHEKFLPNSEQLKLAKESIDHFHHVVLSFEGAFTWFDCSAVSDYRYCDGDQNLNWNGLGFKTVLEVLMKKFPDPSKQLGFDQKVLLNKEVVQILWNTSKATVVCSDGTTYEGDHVIFTPSVGVLKEKHEAIFSPPLSVAKKEAIKNIGIGAVMKVPMHFKNRWWESDFHGFSFIWSEDDRNGGVSKEFPEGPLKEGRSWLSELVAVVPAERNPNVLIAWFTGDMVPEIELIVNKTMIEGLEFALNKFVGHKYNVTGPDSIIRSRWYSNPHFRGTYSFQTVEARMSNVSVEELLAEPLLNIEGRPIVMFAGEASHPYFYSTVHGAIETGHREADRIIDLYE